MLTTGVLAVELWGLDRSTCCFWTMGEMGSLTVALELLATLFPLLLECSCFGTSRNLLNPLCEPNFEDFVSDFPPLQAAEMGFSVGTSGNSLNSSAKSKPVNFSIFYCAFIKKASLSNVLCAFKIKPSKIKASTVHPSSIAYASIYYLHIENKHFKDRAHLKQIQ